MCQCNKSCCCCNCNNQPQPAEKEKQWEPENAAEAIGMALVGIAALAVVGTIAAAETVYDAVTGN